MTMPFPDLGTIVNFATIIKAGVIILIVLYLLFGLILIRQIQLMTKVVEVPIAALLKIIVIFHFLLTVLLLTTAFTIL